MGREGQDEKEYISTMCGFIGEWSLLPTSLEQGQLLYEPGKEGRGHCQSSAGGNEVI